MNQPVSPTTGPSIQQIAVAVVRHEGRYLVGQRAKDQTLAGKAEFPGGKVLPGESPAEAAVRECREETGLEVEISGSFDPIVHTYPHGTLELHFFRCRLAAAGSPRAPFAWAPTEDLARLHFPAANRAILTALAAEEAKPGIGPAR